MQSSTYLFAFKTCVQLWNVSTVLLNISIQEPIAMSNSKTNIEILYWFDLHTDCIFISCHVHQLWNALIFSQAFAFVLYTSFRYWWWEQRHWMPLFESTMYSIAIDTYSPKYPSDLVHYCKIQRQYYYRMWCVVFSELHFIDVNMEVNIDSVMASHQGSGSDLFAALQHSSHEYLMCLESFWHLIHLNWLYCKCWWRCWWHAQITHSFVCWKFFFKVILYMVRLEMQCFSYFFFFLLCSTSVPIQFKSKCSAPSWTQRLFYCVDSVSIRENIPVTALWCMRYWYFHKRKCHCFASSFSIEKWEKSD